KDRHDEDALAVGAECHAAHNKPVTDLTDLLAGLGVPQPCRLVISRGDDAPAVGAERRARYAFRIARERLTDLLAGPGVPQPRRLVVRRGDDAPAVRAERRAVHAACMAREWLTDLLAGPGVPHPRRLVVRGDEAPAVGAEHGNA